MSEFFLINNAILPPHVVLGVAERVRSSVHSTSLHFRQNFLHVFAQHKTEDVRTTTRHNLTTWNFTVIFFGTSSFQSCVFVHSAISIPTSQASNFPRCVRLRFYTKRAYGRTICITAWFFHRWCNKLWATYWFFYFCDLWCSRLITGLISLLKTQSLYRVSVPRILRQQWNTFWWQSIF